MSPPPTKVHPHTRLCPISTAKRPGFRPAPPCPSCSFPSQIPARSPIQVQSSPAQRTFVWLLPLLLPWCFALSHTNVPLSTQPSSPFLQFHVLGLSLSFLLPVTYALSLLSAELPPLRHLPDFSERCSFLQRDDRALSACTPTELELVRLRCSACVFFAPAHVLEQHSFGFSDLALTNSRPFLRTNLLSSSCKRADASCCGEDKLPL